MSKNQRLERDYRDICYFVDHVKNLDLRVDIIKSLGYKVGFNIVNDNNKEKDIIIGKRKEHRIQITPKMAYAPLAQCAIVE